jgi:hypothetical protein
METFVQTAVVDNLLHTIEHCHGDGNAEIKNVYADRLYGISEAVIFKAIISILKSAAKDAMTRHFAEKSGKRNISDLGKAVAGLLDDDKRGIKERVAGSLDFYRDFNGIGDPYSIIDALFGFLVKIGCLVESFESSSSDKPCGDKFKTYYFSHNALMSYAAWETANGISSSFGEEEAAELKTSVWQAAEGCINENIVFTHVWLGTTAGTQVFKYRDGSDREVDIVAIDRTAQTLHMFEVKSNTKTDSSHVFYEARHMYDSEVLKNLGITDSWNVIRALVYSGESLPVYGKHDILPLLNIEDFLLHYKNLPKFVNGFLIEAAKNLCLPKLARIQKETDEDEYSEEKAKNAIAGFIGAEYPGLLSKEEIAAIVAGIDFEHVPTP